MDQSVVMLSQISSFLSGSFCIKDSDLMKHSDLHLHTLLSQIVACQTNHSVILKNQIQEASSFGLNVTKQKLPFCSKIR